MNENQSGQYNVHTWELFQAIKMRLNTYTGIQGQEHVYAAPPPTVLHTSKCGVEVPVPSPLDWRD